MHSQRPYPGDERIADSDARYASYEGHAVTSFHRGKSWQTITLSHLLDDYAGDPSACLAFLVASFTRVAQDLGLEPEFVLATHSDRFEERFSGLTAAEVEAVRMVLLHLAEHVDSSNAAFAGPLPNRPREALESWQYRSPV
jgi:hypothetical protein